MGIFLSAALALTVVVAVSLLVSGSKQLRNPATRTRGILMIVCAIVFIGNVLIWTI